MMTVNVLNVSPQQLQEVRGYLSLGQLSVQKG